MESPSGEFITCETLGLRVGQLQELAYSVLDMETLKLVLSTTSGNVRTIFGSIGDSMENDTTSIHSCEMLLLYLYLTGRAEYRLTRDARIAYCMPMEEVISPADVESRDVTNRLARVKKMDDEQRYLIGPLCDMFADTFDPAVRGRLLMRIYLGVKSTIIRPDYREILPMINAEHLSSKKTHVHMNRFIFLGILDAYRILMRHKYGEKFDDIKTAILGSETRRKKLDKIDGFPLMDIDRISEVGKALRSALHL